MKPEDFLSIGIVGVGLSTFIEVMKLKFGTTSVTTKVLTVIMALAVGTGFYLLQGTVWWQTILGVLGASSAFYAFFLK